jgi:hypothetical protein
LERPHKFRKSLVQCLSPSACVGNFFKVRCEKRRWLYFLDLPYTRTISFPLFFLYISAATAGHKNGVERYKNGVKKAVLVTKTERRSHERSEQNRSL